MKKRIIERVGHLRSERINDRNGEGYGGKGVRSGAGEWNGVA